MSMSRQHVIHKDNGKGKPICNVKGWICFDNDWENVECKFCLKKQVLPLRRFRNGKYLTVRDIYSKEDRANYVKNFPKESIPDKSKKVKPWTVDDVIKKRGREQ